MARSYIEFWDWFNGFGDQAIRAKDEARIRLYHLHGKASKEWEKYPEQTLSIFREGAFLAEQLNEPWMVLFYEYWVVETLLLWLSRYEEGLDLATKLVTKASQERYRDWPLRASAFNTLVTAYALLDGLSYIDESHAMIDSIETEMVMDKDTHLRLIFRRSRLALLVDDRDKALEGIHLYLEMSTSSYRKTGGYETLSYISYLQGEDQKALEYVHLAHEHAVKSRRLDSTIKTYWWQAVVLFLRGDPEEAARLFRLGVGEANQLERPKDTALWGGACRYYEVTGAYDKALRFWDEQVQLMNPETPNRQTYFTVFLRRCFVLRKLGCLTEADIEQTRQAALRMRKPEKYLALMDELHDGKTEIPRY